MRVSILDVNKQRGTFKVESGKSYFPENEKVKLDSEMLSKIVGKTIEFEPGKDRGLTKTYRKLLKIDGKPVKLPKQKEEKKQKASQDVWDAKDLRISRQVCLQRAAELALAADLQKGKRDLKKVAKEIIDIARVYEDYVYEGMEK